MNGVGIGAIVALGALGLSVTYRYVGFVNFAYPEFMTFSAYLTIIYHNVSGNLILSVFLTSITMIIFSLLLEKVVWLPARRKKTLDSVHLLILAVAVGMFLRGLIIFIWGNRPMSFDVPVVVDHSFLGFTFPSVYVAAVAVTLVSVFLIYLLVNYTDLGLRMNAVGDDTRLASISGIDVNKAVNISWVLSSLIAVMAGVLYGMTGLVVPYMSFNLLLPMFAALLIGGLKDPVRTVLGGFLVGMVQEVSTIVISPEFKSGVSLIIVVLLLVRREEYRK